MRIIPHASPTPTPAAAGGDSVHRSLWKGWQEGSVYWGFRSRVRLFCFGGIGRGIGENQFKTTNSKRESKRIPPASSFAPNFLRLDLKAGSLDHIRAPPPRASFVPGRNLKKGETTQSTGGPRQPGLVTRRGGGEGRRRGCGWRRWRQGQAFLCAPGRVRDPDAGTGQPPPDRGVLPA